MAGWGGAQGTEGVSQAPAQEGLCFACVHPTTGNQAFFPLQTRAKYRHVCKPAKLAPPASDPQDARVAQAAAQRCRDRDEGVRCEAFALLGRLPLPCLRRSLHLSDWQSLLDCGLAGPLPSGHGAAAGPGALNGAGNMGRQSASRHAAAVRNAASELLQRYLGLWDRSPGLGSGNEEEGEEQETAGPLSEEGGERAATPAMPAWQRRLQLLLPSELLELGSPGAPPLPGGPAAAAAVQRLLDGWRSALLEALDTEQLATLGLGTGMDGASAEEAATDAERGMEGWDAAQAAGGAADQLALEWE